MSRNLDLPAVLARIIRFSECRWRTALFLRLVCDEWAEALEYGMFGDLIMTASKDDETSVDVRSSFLELPPIMRRIRPSDWATKHAGFELLTATYSLSLVGFFPAKCNLPALRRAFPNLEVLRLCPSAFNCMSYLPYVPFGARAISIFVRSRESAAWNIAKRGMLVELPVLRPGMHNLIWDRSGTAASVYPPNCPRSLSPKVQRIVLNTHSLRDAVPFSSLFNLPAELPAHVKEVIIVVPRYVFHVWEGNGGILYREEGSIFGWDSKAAAAQLASMLTAPHVSYTVVGLDEVKVPNIVPLFRDLLRSALWNRDRKACAHRRRTVDTPADAAARHERVAEIMSRVKMLSLKEYIATKGPGAHELVGLEVDDDHDLRHILPDEGWKRPKEYLDSYPDFNIAPEIERPENAFFEFVAEHDLL